MAQEGSLELSCWYTNAQSPAQNKRNMALNMASPAVKQRKKNPTVKQRKMAFTKAMKAMKAMKQKNPPAVRRLSRGQRLFEEAHLKVVRALEHCELAKDLLDDALMSL